MEMKKKLPIGIENFEKIRTEGFYYIDNTGLIRELLQNWGEVNLFTRPRRFGKSLNMSMLKSFFEIGCDSALFDGLKITGEKALCDEYMGKFPVISISLKSVSGADFTTARAMMCTVIAQEALRFQFLLKSDRLTELERQQYARLVMSNEEGFVMSNADLMSSLLTLSVLVQKHYGQKVIILIDEYDVPLDKAMQAGYYDDMVNLLSNLFGQALKTNDSLQFAVMTGCLRVSKESIFTGLNNLKVLTIMDVQFDEYFGFTDREVRDLLDYYEMSDLYDTVKEWYDGYHFGNVDVYCPWDVICYCDKLRTNPDEFPGNYWSNTSGNGIIRQFIEMARGITRQEIEQLMAGDTVEKIVRQELTYKELYDSIDNMWSILFTTGYLTQKGKPEGRKITLAIPNKEIREIFESQIMEWFRDTTHQDGAALEAFCEAFEEGNAAGVEEKFNAYLKKTISIRDTGVRKNQKENFYHGILLGLLGYKDSWSVSSNTETGEGYSDILVEIDDKEIGIIIEVKYAENADFEAGCRKAMDQIEKKHYEETLVDAGMQTIFKFGIACYKKRCRVVVMDQFVIYGFHKEIL